MNSGPSQPDPPVIDLAMVNKLVQDLANKDLSDEVQEQLTRVRSFIDSWPEKEITNDFITPLLTTISALSAPHPNILLAQGILWDLEFYLSYYGSSFTLGGLLMQITGGWPMSVVLVGLAGACVIFAPILIVVSFLYSYGELSQILDLSLLLAMFFGLLGGCISVLTRIKRPLDLQQLNPISVFLNCLFKPLVGAIFAVIVLFMLKSNLVGGALNIGGKGDTYLYLIAVIGFVTGFSERVAIDAISGVEATFSRKPPSR